jgi:hypothetical protein
VHDQPASSRALTYGHAGEAHAARGQKRRRSSPRGRFARRAERAAALPAPPRRPTTSCHFNLLGFTAGTSPASTLYSCLPLRPLQHDIRDHGKGRSEPESSINGCIPTAYWSSCKPAQRKALISGAFAEPSNGLEPSTPSLPWNDSGNWSQPTATVFPYLSRFSGRRICHRLPPVATARLHKRSIPSFAGVVDDTARLVRPSRPAARRFTGEGVP